MPRKMAVRGKGKVPVLLADRALSCKRRGISRAGQGAATQDRKVSRRQADGGKEGNSWEEPPAKREVQDHAKPPSASPAWALRERSVGPA